jgi:SAM-dependent methyltransferase
VAQKDIDQKNAAFWDELCGSGLARALGIVDASPASLRRFDEAFMALYPYLDRYLPTKAPQGERVLEIGLGYGTLGQILASKSYDYYGIDIAIGPAAMMRYRLDMLWGKGKERVQVGSALEIPYKDNSFEYVFTIGCLHHTGNVRKAVAEVHRVLVPGGTAIVMLYNRHSFRQLVQIPLMRLRHLFSAARWAGFHERVRALYDTNEQGEVAPHTDYVSPGEARRLFKDFSTVKIDKQNFDTFVLFKGKIILPRERLLNNLGRVIGLDLYIRACK